jgi:nicotinamide-nucleotide amidase
MSSASANPIRASLLSIGDELLLGEIIDTNMPYIAQRLLPLGIVVAGTETIGDELHEIVAAFERALARSTIVIATGGLGPTDDDLTFEAVAKAGGVDLEFREEVMEQMAARLKRDVRTLGGSNRKQAMVPRGSRILKNDWGTAPGVHFETREHKHIFLMPGVPREMKGLLGERILPFLAEKFPAPHAIAIESIHCFGIGESIVGERIKPMMQAGHNPNVGTRVGGGTVTVRLVAHGATPAEAKALLDPCVLKVRDAVKEGVFGSGSDTIASATVRALIERKATVALAESCTAGMIASMLADIPGASAALLEGAVVYSNEAKVRACGVKRETLAAHGAVSAQTAGELAEGIRTRANATFGLSITGIAGPTGGTETKPIGLVYFGIATPKGVKTIERNLPGLDRNTLRERASTIALDILRRAVLDNQ